MVKCVDCYHYGFCIGNGGSPCNIYRPDYETLQQLLSTYLGENDALVDKLDKMQQELAIAQKAVGVLAGVMRDIGKCPAEVLCIDDFDTINFDCEHCNDNAAREYRNGIKCWRDYAYAKAKEKEGER